jgi:ferredoxin--NADP+ reductase
MMKELLREGRPRRAVFINGVSYEADLGYRDLLEGWARTQEYPVTYVPTVSRPGDPANAGWTGWTGRTEAVLARALDEYGLTPENAIAYICGNPDMILAAEEIMAGRGFPEAQVKKELYWPKGKEPRSLGPAGVAVPRPDDE